VIGIAFALRSRVSCRPPWSVWLLLLGIYLDREIRVAGGGPWPPVVVEFFTLLAVPRCSSSFTFPHTSSVMVFGVMLS